MKKAVFAVLVACALPVVGCSSEPPQAREYSDMADWNDEIDNSTDIKCKHRKVVDASSEEEYRNECIDDKGRKALMATYRQGADKVNAVNNLASNPLASSMLPAVLVGPNWTVKCLDEDGKAMCEQWQREIGGDIRLAPDYH